MKHPSQFRILPLAGALCFFLPRAEAGVIPDGFPVGRYTALWDRSPFTTASVQQDAPQAGFAEKLVLVGIATIGSRDMATLFNKESMERMIVSSEPNMQGLKLVSVDTNPDPLKTTVTIQKGAEVAHVRFDKTQMVLASQPAPGGNPSGAPQQAVPAPNQPVAPPPPPGRQVRMPPIPAPNFPQAVPRQNPPPQ